MAADGFKKKLLSALGWSAALKIGFQALSWVMTLAVIRVLSPADYGLMAIASMFTTFLLGFANLGLGDALMQKEDTPRSLVSAVFGMLLLVSAVLCAGLSLAAYPLATWYGDPRLVTLIQLSSLSLLFNATVVVPRTMLAKRMLTQVIFAADLASGLVGAVVTTAMAFSGYAVWSLIVGQLASSVARQVAYVLIGWRYYTWPRIDVRAIRSMLGFGAYSTLEYMAWIMMTSADVLIVSRVLGPSALGIYTVVLNFAALPLSKMAPIVNSIAFPAFAMVQSDRSGASYYMLKGVRMMAVLVVPVFFGIAATAPEIVDIVFGPGWAAARPLLPILSLALVFRALLILLPNYLMGTGDPKGSFACTAIGAVVFPAGVLVGCLWGLGGVCWAWLICYPAVFAVEGWIAATRSGFPVRDILHAPVRPLVSGIIMAAGVTALRLLLPGTLPEMARVAALVLAGAVIYPAALLLLFRPLALEVRNLLWTRKTPSAPVSTPA